METESHLLSQSFHDYMNTVNLGGKHEFLVSTATIVRHTFSLRKNSILWINKIRIRISHPERFQLNRTNFLFVGNFFHSAKAHDFPEEFGELIFYFSPWKCHTKRSKYLFISTVKKIAHVQINHPTQATRQEPFRKDKTKKCNQNREYFQNFIHLTGKVLPTCIKNHLFGGW